MHDNACICFSSLNLAYFFIWSMQVMVFIQGGALVQGGHRTFECGSMATENDVIVAVVQYRVGVFGWISSGDEVLPGKL